ncbi:Hypothetical protein FKW44_005467 [Caligus rogercresseyi]|uniref:Uncharacterized protein n=1 Tax=Caligus rogercresseyi TaxID=217165 RepID=A0A7T8KC13_CALRO|nr:Hypothetical protein FKW44_005467 [Caligus rogercresseyi]
MPEYFTDGSKMSDGVGLAGALPLEISPFKKDAEILTGTTRYFKQSWKGFYRQYEL